MSMHHESLHHDLQVFLARRGSGRALRGTVQQSHRSLVTKFFTVSALVLALSSLPAVATQALASPALFPVTVHGANGAVQVQHRPVAIISLSPTATEDLFAIGAGAQVKAVDNQSDYPSNAPKTNLSGYQPNVEAVAKYAPDLVIVAEDSNGFVASLEKLKIPVLIEPAAGSLQDAYSEMLTLGRATGHLAAAQRLVNNTKISLRSIVAAAPHFAHPLSYYYELDQTYYSATSTTFIGHVLSLFGLHDIADAAKGAGGGYPQLSAEYIIHAAPDLVVLADTICCGQSAKTVAARPGWNAIPAVKDGDVVALNDDIASRWGPRIIILAKDIEQALWKRARQH